MKDFIIELYKNPNFPLYVGILIAALTSLFIIIFLIAHRDKKKLEETQSLQLAGASNTDGFASYYNPAIPPLIPASDIEDAISDNVEKKEANQSFLSAPGIPDSIKQNPETEVVPVINPNDIPDTPEVVESNPAFVSNPDIKPVIDNKVVQNTINNIVEIEKDLNTIETAAPAKVAPVEIIADSLDFEPPKG